MPQQMNMGGYVPENIFAYGGQHGHSLDLGSKKVYEEMGQPDPYAVSNSKLQPVPREMANLEAERGETAYGDLDSDGMMELQEIAGKRHSQKDQYGQGGTPLNLKPGTFIYSDTKAMKLGGAELAQFGKSANSKKKYTPAELSKQYDIAKYKAIIEDPNADPIAKRTAQYMMNNNTFKLAQLALAQEAKKGFANGIPQVAFPALPREMQEQLQGQQEAESQEMPNEASEYMQNGGTNNPGFKALPDYVQHQILSNMAYGGYTTGVFAEGGEPNGAMALGQMSAVADKMSKLRQFVSPEQNLDPWIASKLAVMDHSAEAIADYMMYNPEAQGEEGEMEEEEMRMGGSTFSGNAWYRDGGTNNPGFDALPEYVQAKILDNMAQGGEMIRRADGSYSRRGMWDNIRANKGSGKKPTKEMLKQEKKIRAQEAAYGGEYGEGGMYIPDYQMAYGGIHIDPSKKGTFKAQATRMDMGVQEAAAHIMANKEDYSPEMVKKAVFAHNFAKEYGGQLDMYQTKGEVKAKTLKTKAELDKFIKQGYTQIPGTNQYRKENTNTIVQAPTITPGKAAVPGQDAVIEKGKPGKKYVPNENTWWRSLSPKQKAAHNAKIRKMVATDPIYTGTPDKVIKEAVAAQEAVPETKTCPPGYTLNPTTGQCELIQKSEDIVQWDPSMAPEDAKVNPYNPQDGGDKFRTMKPDDWAVNQAMMSMAGIPQMNPYMANPRMTQVKGVFMDPTRAYAANAEAAAQQLAAARTFANPRSFAAAASQVAGKQLEGNANIDTTINGQNVAIANQLEAMNAQYRDKYFGDKMKTDSLYNEQVNAVNKENFRNLDAASKQMLAARQNQFNNAMMMDMVNKNNQYYSVNPRTGETFLKAGKDPFTDKAGTPSGNALELMKKHAADYAAAFPDSTSAERQKYAQEMVIGKQTTRYDSTGAMSGINQILPYLALMGKGQAAAFQRYGGLVDARAIFPF